MQEASNIYIRLINLQIPCSEETAQAMHYNNMSGAVKSFERIRGHATSQDQGNYAVQFCVNRKIVSEYFLDDHGYKQTISELGFNNSRSRAA